jgi:hypothetical protein
LVVFGRANALHAVRESRAAIDAVNAVYGEPPFTSLVLLKSNAVDR